MTKKVKVAFDGKVVGEAEVNDAGEVVNAEIYPEDVSKLFPNRNPLEGISIAEPSREMPLALQDFAREDIDMTCLLHFKNYRTGPKEL